MEHPRFQHPFTCTVAGTTGSGKTSLVRKILDNHRLLVRGLPQHKPLRVLWCYGIQQKLHKVPINECTVVYSPELTEEVLKRENPTILVVDDMMQEKANDPFLSSLFTRGSHHMGISVFFLVQNLYMRTPLMRTINLNSTYVILAKSPRDMSQSQTLARQLYPDNTAFFRSAYRDALAPPFGYLLVDLSQTCPDKLRLRTDIFNIHPKFGYLPTYYIPS